MAIDALAQPLGTAVERALGRPVERMAVVHGGDVAAAFRLELVGGGVLFARPTLASTGVLHHRGSRADLAPRGERGAGARGGRRVGRVGERRVMNDTPPFLVLEWIDEGRPRRRTDADLGAALAALHDAGAPTLRP